MNKRIREPYYSLMYKASEGWNDHLFQVPPELMEKFAELIIDKCINICISNRHDDSAFHIEEHFGVEE